MDVNVEGFTAKRALDDGRRVVYLGGDLDACSAPDLVEMLSGSGGAPTDVDMAAVRFMDCAGYGALAAACQAFPDGGRFLRLCRPSGQPLALLRMFDELLIANPRVSVG